MSFTSAFSSATGAGARLLRGTIIRSMGRALGVVISASVLAATCQLMLDEGRIFVRTLSACRQRRHARHELVLVQVLGKGLAAAAENQLLNSRDAFAEALKLLATGRSR